MYLRPRHRALWGDGTGEARSGQRQGAGQQMFKRTIFTSVVIAGVTLTLGMGPAQGNQGKSEAKAAAGAADKALLDAEAAAGRSAAGVVKGKERALQAIQANIARHVERNGGQHSFASFVDPDTGRIVVETDAPSGLLRALTAVGGDVEVRQASLTDAFSRKADTSPFWGGSGIKSGGAVCSSGFVVKKSTGVRYLTTAGHCFAQGAGVLTETGNLSVGSVVQRGPIPPYDMELIGGKSYGSSIFVGGVNSSTGNPVVAAADPVVNFTGYCTSGRTTGEQCGHKVVAVDAQVCTQTGCKSPVIRFQATSGSLPTNGDSGSPFYIKSGTNVHIRGMFIAMGNGYGYAEKWSRISSHLGVSIVTA